LAGFNSPSQFLNLETFTLATNLNAVDLSAGISFNLKMTVASKSVSLRKKYAFKSDIETVVYDAVVSQALPLLGKLQDMQDIVNNIDTIITDKVNEVGNAAINTGMAAYNTGVNTLKSKSTEAINTLTSKTSEYANGAKNYILNACKGACPGGCCGFNGWCKDRCNDVF
jgi:hypothetical protein